MKRASHRRRPAEEQTSHTVRAVDPHSLHADPDPAVFMNADLDPDPDPDPGPGLA